MGRAQSGAAHRLNRGLAGLADAVEQVDGAGPQGDVAFPGPGVAAQLPRRPQVVGRRPRQIIKRRDVVQRGVEPLRADRRQDMRRLRHQRGAFGGQAVGRPGDHRPDADRPGRRHRTQQVAGPGGHLGAQFPRRQRRQRLRPGSGVHPDDGACRCSVVIRQRHGGEGAAPVVDFGRDISVRQRVGDRKRQRLLAVADCAGGDAGRLADRRVAAIGADHQPCAQPRAVAQRDDCLAGARQHRTEPASQRDPDAGLPAGKAQHLAPGQPVGQFPAEGVGAHLAGREGPGLADLWRPAAGIDDTQCIQRDGMGRKHVPKPDFLEQRARGLQKRGRPQIGCVGVRRFRRRRRIGQQHRKPRMTEGRGGGQPGDPAARDEDIDVRFTHAV